MTTVRLATKPYLPSYMYALYERSTEPLTQAARRTHPEKQATYHLPIREFMEKYRLEELLQEETPTRWYQRWRAKK